MKQKSYFSMLVESVKKQNHIDEDTDAREKRPTEYKGPMIDPILNFKGDGDLTVKKAFNEGQTPQAILERYYFEDDSPMIDIQEDDDLGIDTSILDETKEDDEKMAKLRAMQKGGDKSKTKEEDEEDEDKKEAVKEEADATKPAGDGQDADALIAGKKDPEVNPAKGEPQDLDDDALIAGKKKEGGLKEDEDEASTESMVLEKLIREMEAEEDEEEDEEEAKKEEKEEKEENKEMEEAAALPANKMKGEVDGEDAEIEEALEQFKKDLEADGLVEG